MKAAINELMGTIHLFSKITIFMCIYIDQFDNFKLCNFSFGDEKRENLTKKDTKITTSFL
ncbi:hypothetical protein DVA79_08920 [Acinetobacter baumannii]|nr:hypothetical protein FDF35_08860 [Acinetobacter baumannii]RCU29455.1 hypothetical protein DVA79_08920 [Acinetobacter baumannii]RCU32888.1 hypothetical protein DVA69_07265 [Acinetobacter baumannii]RCU35696.1 hypothetical protein DVA81_14980 [Acinetobacter baumannii]